MTPTDAIGTLAIAFHKDLAPEAVAIYVDAIVDLDPELLRETVRQCIASLKFFPAISEIRRAAARVAGTLPPSSGEIVALLRRADVREPVYRRDGSFAYTERYWRWPEGTSQGMIDLCEMVLEKAGEPCDEDGHDTFGWETAARKVYEGELPRLEAEALSDLSSARLLPEHETRRLNGTQA